MIFLIAIGLAMDAFAVALCNGMQAKKVALTDALKTGAVFGLFQGFMPYIGWLAGERFAGNIEKYDHWIAFALLGYLGISMILTKEDDDKKENVFSTKSLLMTGLATSVDALVMGIVFNVSGFEIYSSILIVGIITFIIASLGVLLGKKVGVIFKDKVTIIGGLILIGIGVRILIEHLIAHG